MRRCILSAIAFTCLVTAAFPQKTTPRPKDKTAALEDTIQYSLGVYMMQQLLAKTGYTLTNTTQFKKAIDDITAGRKLMVDPATVEARLTAYQQLYQLEKGRKLEQLLFAKIKSDPKFISLPSGVLYTLVQAGKGPVPALNDTVIININGRLPDGTILDDVSKSKQSYMALTSDMIPGLRDVIRKMQEGSIVTAVIPASQAYGETGTSAIPPNSALIYDIALVSVRKSK
jgi:FKBP-type peptidyl-prolyl cis-trans isomerase